MGGSTQDYYTTSNGNALIGSQTTLPQFLNAIASASANPAQNTAAGTGGAAAAGTPTAGGSPAAGQGAGMSSTPTGGGMASPSGGISQGSNVGGVRSDIADKAQTFGNANVAVNPSMKSALSLAGDIVGPGIPFAGEAVKALLGMNTSFNVAGPQLSAQQTQQIKDTYSSVFAMTNSPMAAQIAAQNQLAGFRAAGQPSGAGVGQPGNAPATGGVDLGGLAGRMGGTAASVAPGGGVDPSTGQGMGGGGAGGAAAASGGGGLSGGANGRGGAAAF